jgi:hypothetical protein
VLGLAAGVVGLLAPSAASAGTALSISADLPSADESGGSVTVGENGLPAALNITQLFTLADTLATAQINLIRLAPACGPGPSPGNPTNVGPAINSPENPCSNPDLKVFTGFPNTGAGKLDCDGKTFTINGPDSSGQLDFIPSSPLLLSDNQTCRIKFGFDVNKLPSKDTLPNQAGIQTVAVAASRSSVVSNPGNPEALNLHAAGMGSSEAVLVKPSAVPGIKGKQSAPGVKLKSPALGNKCIEGKFGARVTGKQIAKVAFKLNGKVIKVDRAAPFKVKVSPRALKVGSNKLVAKVSFVRSANRKPVKLSGLVFRCKAPSFTG